MSDETEASDVPTNDERPQADELAVADDAQPEIDESKSAPADRAEAGPFDVSEVPAMRPYVDLGGIKVAPREGLQMRLDVDDRAKRVVAVTLTFGESMVQVQAFSAPKTLGLWHQVRSDIVRQMTTQGAQVREEDGTLGPELVVTSKVPADKGGGTREARFIGVDGPRWLLRGVVMGKATREPEARQQIDTLFRDLVVVRGDHPMPPSELIPLQVPAGMTQAGGAQSGGTNGVVSA